MSEVEFVKLSVGDVFHGRYRIDRLIKTGGFGAVYEVFDQNTDGRRALKVMLQNAFEDPELYERFMREVKIAGSIESDHIVRVYDAGTDTETKMPFMVMELLEGEELAALAKRQAKLQRPLPWGEILEYLTQTARALDKVHTHPRRIVHRDLKPQNLFVTHRESGEVCIKVLDFGIAKIDTTDRTHTRELGTPKYMAPEQVRGQSRKIGPATDTYALAHIAYTLLAGEAYWTEEERNAESSFLLLANIVAGIQEAPVARVLRRNKVELPAAFDGWFLKATAMEPEARFAKATECVAALGEVLGFPQQRRTMQSEATLDPEPPVVPPSVHGYSGTTDPPLPSALLPDGAGSHGSGGVDEDPGRTSASGQNSTDPTGNTKQGVTKSSSLRVPVRSWGAAIGGGLALGGALVLVMVIWKLGTPPGEVPGVTPSSSVAMASPSPSSVSQPSSAVEASAPVPPTDAAPPLLVDAGLHVSGLKDGGKPPQKDGGPLNSGGSSAGAVTATATAQPTTTTQKSKLDTKTVD